MGYVTRDELKKTLQIEAASTYVNEDLDLAIAAATAAVDHACGRRFTKDDADVTRLYVPTRETWLEIDDLSEAATLIESGVGTFTAWEPDDFNVDPLNAVADAEPITALKLTPGSSITFLADTVVRVTGTFGWPEVPPGAKQATSLIASRLLKRGREAPFGVAGLGGDGVAVRITNSDPDVRMLLSPLVRPVRLA